VDAAQLEVILKLDVDERVRIVQAIWDSIAASNQARPPTDAERQVVESLIAEDEAAPDDVVPWAEARAMIRPRR
jgi:putative addiction module component (TIGR02574 family)